MDGSFVCCTTDYRGGMHVIFGINAACICKIRTEPRGNELRIMTPRDKNIPNPKTWLVEEKK